MPYFETPAGQTIYYADPCPTNAPVVLMLHSSGLASKQWKRLSVALAPTHRPVAVDLIGYGKSGPFAPADGRPFHYSDDLDAVEALAVELGGPMSLVGHSYGGLLALRLAARGAVEVSSVAVYEPVAFSVLRQPDGSPRPARSLDTPEALEAFFSLEDGMEAWLERFVGYWQGSGAWGRLLEPVRAQFRACAPKMYDEVRSLSYDDTPPEVFSKIKAPTLLLAGSRTTEGAKAIGAALEALLHEATYVEVEGAGHIGPITHSARVNAIICGHLG